MEFDIEEMSKILHSATEEQNDRIIIVPHMSGGADNLKETILENTTAELEDYEPHITRETLSIYEYVAVITKLAKYIFSLMDIDKYIKEVELNQVVNPSELAFNLLNDGKFDAIIDRGYEKVTFSKLKIREQWKETIRNYFKFQHQVIEEEVLKPLNLNA